MKRILIALSLLLASSSLSWGQATSTASRADFELGGTYSFVLPDYTPQKAQGFGIYTNYFLTPHFGVELDYHRATISQHSPASESTFEYGLAYRRVYNIYRPYGRVAFGRGTFNFPSQTTANTSVADLSYNLYAVAGGLDVEATRTINIRAEFEYQSWFSAPGLTNGLTPTLFTIGAAYHFNPRDPRY